MSFHFKNRNMLICSQCFHFKCEGQYIRKRMNAPNLSQALWNTHWVWRPPKTFFRVRKKRHIPFDNWSYTIKRYRKNKNFVWPLKRKLTCISVNNLGGKDWVEYIPVLVNKKNYSVRRVKSNFSKHFWMLVKLVEKISCTLWNFM